MLHGRVVARRLPGRFHVVSVEPSQQPADAHAGGPGVGRLLQRHATAPLLGDRPRTARLRQEKPRRNGIFRTYRVPEGKTLLSSTKYLPGPKQACRRVD